MSSEKSLLQFPCEFPIKIFGHHNDEFEIAVLTIARAHFPNLPESALKQRTSNAKKFLAFTLTITAESQTQLDALYQALTADKNVLMVI